MGVIYKITNLVNGKVYVGKTTSTLATRWCEHQSRARHGSKRYIHCAIRKYGIDNFTIEQIDEAPNGLQLDASEIGWINTLQASDRTKGYNCTPGGEGAQHGPSSKVRQKGWRTLSAETRRKISEAHKGKKRSPEAIAKMRAGLTGRKESREAVAKRVATNRELWKDPERKARQAEASRKRLTEIDNRFWEKVTPEVVARRNQSIQRWRESPEGAATLKAAGERRRGRRRSSEAVEKMRQTILANPDIMQRRGEKIRAAKALWWSKPENQERMKKVWEAKRLVAAS